MNKQEAAAKYAAEIPAVKQHEWRKCEERRFLAGWDAAIEAAAKVAEQFQYVVQHKAGEFGVIRLPAEIRKLAE